MYSYCIETYSNNSRRSDWILSWDQGSLLERDKNKQDQ